MSTMAIPDILVPYQGDPNLQPPPATATTPDQGGWGSILAGLNNIGLNWYQASTKGFSGPVTGPAPVVPAGQVKAGLLSGSGSGLLLLAVLGIVAYVIVKKA